MKTTRRSWMTGALGLGLAPFTRALAVTEPYTRIGKGLKVGLAAYSFRDYFEFSRGKENPKYVEGKKAMDMPGFIEYCAKQGVAGAELTSYFFPPECPTEYYAHCHQIAHLNGVQISGTAVGNNFSYPAEAPERVEQIAYVKQWIDYATLMGAPHIRVFAGKHPQGVSGEEAEQNAVGALTEAAVYAAEKGVFLGIENHDSIATADRLLRIVRAVDSPWVGVNLDSGNFIADDVYAEITASAPFAVNVQLKTEMRFADGRKEPADLERVVKILKDTGYAGFVTLEFEEATDPYEQVPPLLEKLQTWCA
ncbi:MAG: sugar phosphate isomerase/epimerase, partial [Verrucomicrobiales bacterium]|nr:sugar phosphate isomerase/epimerase [Verrucomicrobiales bacterium]MBP9223280.1 sugar phosphate isomerase/epimerase [Verrucomicrobiales bacterium]HQZ30089.1 sugar phosphate isomerase/epimerase family protein [Verrucomicrobiales bacterium]